MPRKKATKKATKRKPGRPRKYTPSQAQKLIDGFFNHCDKAEKPYTITGLALALDTSRQSLCNWIEREDEMAAVVERAKTRVEHFLEELLLTARNPVGAIFALKNHGWSDRQQLEVSGTLDLAGRLRAGRDRLAQRSK